MLTLARFMVWSRLLAVYTTLSTPDGSRRYRLAVFTKGELMDQENKLRRSGLLRFFDVVSIVSDKTPEAYHALCSQLAVNPDELLMVGNSFKSDCSGTCHRSLCRPYTVPHELGA